MANATEAKKTEAAKKFHADIAVIGYEDDKNAKIAARIRELSGVIRSAKWNDAVEGYAQFVEAHPDATQWAYFQGSVYFSYQVM